MTMITNYYSLYSVDILWLSLKVTTNLPDVDIEPFVADEPHEPLHWGLVLDSRPWQNIPIFPHVEGTRSTHRDDERHLDELGGVQLAKYLGSLSRTVRMREGCGAVASIIRRPFVACVTHGRDAAVPARSGSFYMQDTPSNVNEYFAKFEQADDGSARRARTQAVFKSAKEEHKRLYGGHPPVPFRVPDQELILLASVKVTISRAIEQTTGQVHGTRDLRLSVELIGKLLRVVVLPPSNTVPFYKSFEPTAPPVVFANEPEWVAYNLTDAIDRASWSEQNGGFRGYVVGVAELEQETVRVPFEDMCGRFRPMFADMGESIRLKSAFFTASTSNAV
ncbi:hypothetical protein BJ742DRAFT_770755 [Cladochytrium replicatum]|nr:hypothetical protein BJ742DRAFT_770755 [Cladochytrium replicatum]